MSDASTPANVDRGATRVLVAGATGYVGARLVPRLLEAGYAVRCAVRSPRKLEDRPWRDDPSVEIVRCDFDDAADLTTAMRGCTAAYYLVHSMVSAGADYADRDRALARRFAQAAATAGVARLVYLGGLGESGDDLSAHLESRREVERELASAGVPVTVFRAAMIIGSGSASFEILRYLVDRLPVMVTPRWVFTESQPIAIRNVLHYLTACLAVAETSGRTLEIGGPERLSYRALFDVMAEERGLRRRLVIPVPVLSPRLSSWWIHLVTPIDHRLARPLADGLRNRVVVSDGAAARLLPQTLLSPREAIRLALAKDLANDVETSWSSAGPIPGDPDWAGGLTLRDTRSVTVSAPPSAVFAAVCRLGGVGGWHRGTWLWKVRGLMDRIAGGPGLRRGRRHPSRVSYGDAVDFWRVTDITRDRHLQLRAEMRVPGDAMLDFHLAPGDQPGTTVLTQEARFLPRGLWGLVYWYLVLPFHGRVFPGVLHGVANAAVADTEARGRVDAAAASR